ncbi:MAG: hypothetical protein QM769_00825 [Pseudoxanthomonas sp.]
MSAAFRHALPRCLRAFALLVLVFGLLARPMAAVACDVEDSRQVVAAAQGIAADAADQQGSDDCCANVACGECCAPASIVMPAMMRLAAAVPMLLQVMPESRGRLEVVVYPVGSRPPIHA